MQGSKIRLSPAEMKLFADAEIILTKNSILQKTVLLLSDVQDSLLNESLPEHSPSPKISKGENYLGLPYLILDYPRISKDNDLLFIRSMFWWGNFFSSTLHISGKHKEAYHEALSTSYEAFCKEEYFVGINSDPWQHHFGEDNFRKIDSLSQNAFSTILEEQPHIKIAARWPLSEWDSAANKLVESWKMFVSLIS